MSEFKAPSDLLLQQQVALMERDMERWRDKYSNAGALGGLGAMLRLPTHGAMAGWASASEIEAQELERQALLNNYMRTFNTHAEMMTGLKPTSIGKPKPRPKPKPITAMTILRAEIDEWLSDALV